MANTTDFTQTIKTWTDYTYDIGIFEGSWRVIGDAIYNQDIPFNLWKMDNSTRYKILSAFHGIYSLIAQVNSNLIDGIDQMKKGIKPSVTIEPFKISPDSWPMPTENPTKKDLKPNVIKDLWDVIDPMIGKLLISYKGNPLIMEALDGIKEKGKNLFDLLGDAIDGTPKKSSDDSKTKES